MGFPVLPSLDRRDGILRGQQPTLIIKTRILKIAREKKSPEYHSNHIKLMVIFNILPMFNMHIIPTYSSSIDYLKSLLGK
jgi:hypothetical protein